MNERVRFRADLAARLRRHEMRWGEPHGPPASWKQGAPIGNGDFGALIYGYPDNLSFALGKTDLWDRSGFAQSRFPTGTFADFRQTWFDGDERAFREFCATVPHGDADRSHATTAGMFRLRLRDAEMAREPTLRVSLWEGIARLTFTPSGVTTNFPEFTATTVEMFASRAGQVLAIRIEPGNCPLGEVGWELSRARHEPHPAAVVRREEPLTWLTQEFTGGDRYAVAVAREHDDDGGGAVFYLTVVTNRDAAEPLAEAQARLTRARAMGYREIARQHRAWWADYWRRGFVCVADAALEKWWYTSLYLCGSMLEPGRQSPGLQAPWIKENVPAWWGDYHSNVNLQAVYWGLFTANRVEFVEPFTRFLTSIADQCRQDTRDYFQMRGLRFPHAGTIDGHELTTAPWANLAVSIGGSSWLTQLCWQVFEYTGDRDYLRQTAYPLLRDVALFYQDYLRWDEKPNCWALEPSLYFEALCPGFASWGKNSLYELTLVHGAFQRAIAAAQELGVDELLRQQWRDILRQLPDLPTDAGGGWIAFTGRDVRPSGSHQFALPPVFPGELVSLWHGPEPWRQQALATLNHPLTAKSMTGKAWCGGQGIREIIRLGRIEQAVAAARWSGADNTNGLIHSWSSHCVQADHGPGMCSVLNDMLLLAPGGSLRLFPCFPDDIPAAFHQLRAPGAFLVTAEKRGPVVDYALLQSLAGRDLCLANPWPGVARLRDAGTQEMIACSAERQLHVRTRAGQVFILDRAELPYETMATREWEGDE